MQATFSPYFTQEPRTKEKMEKMEELYSTLIKDLAKLIKYWDAMFDEKDPQRLLTLSDKMSILQRKVYTNMGEFFTLCDDLWMDFLKWKDNVERDMHRP